MPPDAPASDPPIAWRDSRAVGKPFAGRLVDGVQLPAEGRRLLDLRLGRCARRRTGRGGAGAPTGSSARCSTCCAGTAPTTRSRRASAWPTSRARTAGGSGRTSAGSATPRTRTGSTSTSSTRAWTASSAARGRPRWSTRSCAQDLVDRFVAAGARLRLHRPAAAPARPAQGRREAHAPRRPHARADPLVPSGRCRGRRAGRPRCSSPIRGSSKRSTSSPRTTAITGALDRHLAERVPGLVGRYLALDDVEPLADREQVLEHLDDARALHRVAEQPPGRAGGDDDGVRAALLRAGARSPPRAPTATIRALGLSSRAVSVISTALSSRSGATITAAASRTPAAVERRGLRWRRRSIAGVAARRASSTASARPSITTIASGRHARARAASRWPRGP